MPCTHCNDTGSLIGGPVYYLDCPHCDTPQERKEFQTWCLLVLGSFVMSTLTQEAAWCIYLHGKEKALENKEKS